VSDVFVDIASACGAALSFFDETKFAINPMAEKTIGNAAAIIICFYFLYLFLCIHIRDAVGIYAFYVPRTNPFDLFEKETDAA
jgi:hypothetical protein